MKFVVALLLSASSTLFVDACDVAVVSTCLQGVTTKLATAGTDISKLCPLIKEMKACIPANCADDATIKQLTAAFAQSEALCGGSSSGGCNILEASQCMTGFQEQIAAAGADQTKMCALIPKLKACFPAACADNAAAKAALAGYAEAEKACASGGGGGPNSGGGGNPCQTACGKASTECMSKDPKNPACMTDAMKCSLKCSMPGIDPAQLNQVVTCMAGCQKDEQTKDECTQKCMAAVIPACFKGPDGTPKDSAVAQCFTAAGIPNDAEGDPDIKTCPQLESAKKCAADSCGGKIPVIFEPQIKELNAGLKCAGTVVAPTAAAAVPTPKPTEIIRTGSPSVVGGTGAPTAAFTLSPTGAPAPAPAPEGSAASSLLPSVAVAIGAAVVFA